MPLLAVHRKARRRLCPRRRCGMPPPHLSSSENARNVAGSWPRSAATADRRHIP
ncbi:MAG: hypothetical protein MZV49_12435 [Rhodopseudomonas palustris]|nr:hypothetical protein [Rhodopseudomonas palustris]